MVTVIGSLRVGTWEGLHCEAIQGPKLSIMKLSEIKMRPGCHHGHYVSPPKGWETYCFSPAVCLSVCPSVCLSLIVSALLLENP